MVDKLKPCLCGRTDSTDNAVQEASVNLVDVKAATGGRAYRVQCDCGWRGPIQRDHADAIAAWNRRTPANGEQVERAFRAGYDAGYNFEAGVTEQWDTENAAWSRYAATLSTPTEDARSRVTFLEHQLAACKCGARHD